MGVCPISHRHRGGDMMLLSLLCEAGVGTKQKRNSYDIVFLRYDKHAPQNIALLLFTRKINPKITKQ